MCAADQTCLVKDVKERVRELNVQLDNLCQVPSAVHGQTQGWPPSLPPADGGDAVGISNSRAEGSPAFRQITLGGSARRQRSLWEAAVGTPGLRQLGAQFLPQDKVGEFAKLKPGELLTETQRAIGDGRLLELHQELIRERKQLKINETVGRMAASAAGMILCRLQRGCGHPSWAGSDGDCARGYCQQCPLPLRLVEGGSSGP